MNRSGIRKATFNELLMMLDELESRLWITPSGKHARGIEISIERVQKQIDDWEHDDGTCKYGNVKNTPTGERYNHECKCEPRPEE